MNTSEKDTNFNVKQVNIEWDKLQNFNMVSPTGHQNRIQKRLEELNNIINLEHCNSEEQKSISNICREYNDLFFKG